jgi:hypothetical protein
MGQQRIHLLGAAVHHRQNALGAPASVNSSARRMGVSGSCSEGLSKAVAAGTASGNIHSGIMAGKLNGVMPTQTPGLHPGVAIHPARHVAHGLPRV